MTLTAFTPFTGTKPNRDSQTGQTLSQNLDNALDFLIDFNGEMIGNTDALNNVVTQAGTASTSADIAAGAANYEGEWSTLSGAKTVPMSCSNDGKIYILKADIANVATVEPGVTASWESTWLEFSVGQTGRTATSTGTNATLDTDVLVQEVTTTADDLLIKLGAAIAFDAGSLAQIIINAGDKKFTLASNGGGINFGLLYPGEIIRLTTKTVSDSDGTWVAERIEPKLNFSEFLAANAVASTNHHSCNVGPGKVLVVYNNATTTYIDGVIVQLNSDGELEIGTPVTIDNENCGEAACCPADVDDEAMVVTVDSGSELNAHKLSISGTVITVEDTRDGIDTAIENNPGTYDIGVTCLGEDLYVASYFISTGPYLVAFTTTGHTINAPGTPRQITGSTSYGMAVKKVRDNSGVAYYLQGGSSARAMGFTVSGTTITNGAIQTFQNGLTGTKVDCDVMDNEVIVFAANDSATNYTDNSVYSATLSGSTLTQVARKTLPWKDPVNVTGRIKVEKIKGNTALIWILNGGQELDPMWVVSVSDDGSLKVLNRVHLYDHGDNFYISNSSGDIARLVDGVLALAGGGQGASGYTYVQTINILELI